MAERGHPTPEEETINEEIGRQPWVDLVPTDVLHSVALRLPPSDFFSFHKVCKLWRSILKESYPLGGFPLLLFTGHYCPPDELHLYSPLYNRTLSLAANLDVLQMFASSASSILYSKYSWIVFVIFSSIFFINPFLSSTAAVIKWRMPDSYYGKSVCMSAPPTDPTCIFLLIQTLSNRIEIITSSDGGRNWNVDSFDYKHDGKFECRTSPAFRGGMFYFLDRSGSSLGIYDPCRRTWARHRLGMIAGIRFCNAFLVESDGELLGVFEFNHCNHLEPWVDHVVCKLNMSSMKWEELKELRGCALFLDQVSAISAVAEVEGMKDRIFYNTYKYQAIKADCELHQSAGGDLRLVPRPHVGLAKLATRAEGELVGRSQGRGRRVRVKGRTVEKGWMRSYGVWVQPNWGQL